MSYEIVFSSRAVKDLRPIPKIHQQRIIDRVELLSDNPYPSGSIKLRGLSEDIWRIRVGNYRILYSVDESILVVDIRRIGHRKDIY